MPGHTGKHQSGRRKEKQKVVSMGRTRQGQAGCAGLGLASLNNFRGLQGTFTCLVPSLR